jgi:DNA-binding response OmpR family regulator
VAVLVVDDTVSELERLAAWLALLGAEVTCARTLNGARAALANGAFHAIVVDRLLPDGDAFDLLPARAQPCGAVIASGYIDARTWAVIEHRGAVPAPKSQLQSPLLLMGFVEEALRRANVQVQVRRMDGDAAHSRAPSDAPDSKAEQSEEERWTVRRGPVAVDLRRRSVTVLGEERRLQPKQFDVLVHLMLKPEKIVTGDELVQTVWADTRNPLSPSIVRSTISRLRSGLGLPGDSFIQTASGGWGIGIWPLLSESGQRKQRPDD